MGTASIQRLSHLVCTKHQRVKFKPASLLVKASKVDGKLGDVATMPGIKVVMGNANAFVLFQ